MSQDHLSRLGQHGLLSAKSHEPLVHRPAIPGPAGEQTRNGAHWRSAALLPTTFYTLQHQKPESDSHAGAVLVSPLSVP